MIDLLVPWSIKTFPGVRIWKTGHLKIEVMEVEGDRCYILPPSINFGCYVGNCGITYHRLHTSVGRRGYINSSNFYSLDELVRCYKEQLQFQKERSLSTGGNGKIPIISRPNYMRYALAHEWTTETLSKGFASLEEALVWVDAVSVNLVRCRYPDIYNSEAKSILYYGRLLNKLYHIHGGDQYLANKLGVALCTARTMRTEAKVPYKHRNKIKLLDTWS